MKILLTLGTTKFDSLVELVDRSLYPKYSDLMVQTCGDYYPSNYPSFKFSDDIERYYNSSDLIICHAGAGTVYKLLEMRKKLIVVPNLERADKHQKELAKYVEMNELGLVAWGGSNLLPCLRKYEDGFLSRDYIVERFFKCDEIVRFFSSQN